MKNNLFLFILTLVINPVILSTSVQAKSNEKMERRMEKKQDVVEMIREKAMRKGMKVNITGEITSIATDSMSITRGDKTVNIYIGADTKLVRKFGGNSTLSEFAVGNKVQVAGNWTDESKSAISATTIRDISIQKLRGVFVGKVTTKGDSSFTIEPLKRKTQTVILNSAIKYSNRRKETIAFTDIKVGDQVKVSGVWDRSNNKIMEVTEIRDLSIPKMGEKLTPTP